MLKQPQEIASEIVHKARRTPGAELTVDDVRLANLIEQAIIDDRRTLKNQFLRLAADAFE
ncbi:MAG: hypothetical protein P4L99_05470 [Chthoniobacter sp.]|nr:hypothetical protein [Chthoniobacter sp.]